MTVPDARIETPAEKACVHCGATKDRQDFPTNRETRDRLSSWCRQCHNAASKRWHDRRRAERRAARGEERKAA